MKRTRAPNLNQPEPGRKRSPARVSPATVLTDDDDAGVGPSCPLGPSLQAPDSELKSWKDQDGVAAANNTRGLHSIGNQMPSVGGVNTVNTACGRVWCDGCRILKLLCKQNTNP